MTEFMEHFDVKTNFLLYDGVVWCIKLLMNALENQNEKKKNQKFQYFVENFIKVPILGFHVTSQYFPNMDVRHICAPRSVKLYGNVSLL